MFTPKIYESWRQKQFEKYAKLLEKLGKEKLQEILSGKVLDIGIGNAYFEEFLKAQKIKAEIVGIDNNEEMIQDADNVILGSGDAIPFPDEYFDCIICLDTIHLLKKEDFKRVLKKDGYAIISIFFNRQNLSERRKLLNEKVKGLKIIEEFIVKGEESEIFMICKK